MRFSLFVVLGLATAAQEAMAASQHGSCLTSFQCRIAESKANCCWGGSNGISACLRQRNGANVCNSPSEAANFCKNVNIEGQNIKVSETCNADCCDTKTVFGTGCPK
ncbi:ec16 protein [Colletotrichum plurivorum]|uniref:Ec16 protein n=1 Tax=Colletotrichum plurivorum TaxID=2175906 RepID=A0A8H6JFD1_9PEZI|nr:ec16 protein [Colletotrichum plurivorum]